MKNKKLYRIIGIVIIIILSLLFIVGLFWTPYSPTKMNAALKNSAPSMSHIFGCDNYGRDIFSRVMSGLGNTFLIAICTVIIGSVIGTFIGLFTGYYGGVADEIIMRFNDIILSFPSVLLALVIISILGKGKFKIIIALGILFIPSFARMARGETIKVKKMGYIESAKALGISNRRIIYKHILPNIFPKVMTNVAVGFNNAVIAESSMSYLGLGVLPPAQSLGRMISEAQSFLFVCPWYAIYPGITIIIMIIGFSLLSSGLSEQ